MKIFYILMAFVLITVQSNSQTGRPAQDPGAKVIRFYPNPAITQITFDIDQNADKAYSFQVYNFVGKKVLDLPTVTLKTIVDVTDFYRGVYIFQLRDKTGRMVDSGKFQVAH